MKPARYVWLFFGLVLFDTISTLVLVRCYGAAEANPMMRWILDRSVLLFIGVKLIPVSYLIYLVYKIGKPIYLKVAFWCYLALYCIGLVGANVVAMSTPVPTPMPHVRHHQPLTWNTAVITTYANKFEGRRMANGVRFHHSSRVLACRGGSLGRIIELRYGRHGRSVCVLSDRGRLPLHSPDRWQFDTTRAVARDLGLYKLVNGQTDRVVRWRYVERQK